MSNSIPKNVGDKREQYANDASIQRKIQLRNLEREAKESSVIWRQKQLDLYKTLISVTKPTTMAEIITSEYNNNEVDDEIELQKGLSNLLQVATPENSQYILDRLNEQEILNMNVQFPQLIKEIKKNSKRIDKNIFIDAIKRLPDIPKSFQNNLSAQGQLNLDSLTARQIIEKDKAEAQEKEFDDYQAELAKKADAELAEKQRVEKIEELTKINRFTRSQTKILSALRKNVEQNKVAILPFEQEELLPSETTPIKVRQTTIIPLAETKKQPAQNTAPPNVIEAQAEADTNNQPAQPPNVIEAEEVIELAPKAQNVKFLKMNLDYNLLKPYLNNLSLNKDVLKQQAKDNYNIKYGKFKELTGHAMNVSSLRTFIAEQQYTANNQIVPYNPKFVDSSVIPSAPVVTTGGTGIKRVKRIIGTGKAHYEKTLSKRKYISNEKFYIDANKLNDNILCIKYSKTEANIPSLRPQSISTDLKDLIQDTIEDKFDNRIFKKLTESDKRIFKRFSNVCKLDIEIDDPDDKLFQQRFEILKGQWLSGNSSIQNKNELKRYILEAYNTNKIPRNEAMLLLYQISL